MRDIRSGGNDKTFGNAIGDNLVDRKRKNIGLKQRTVTPKTKSGRYS